MKEAKRKKREEASAKKKKTCHMRGDAARRVYEGLRGLVVASLPGMDPRQGWD